jgi:hypothetical protein
LILVRPHWLQESHKSIGDLKGTLDFKCPRLLVLADTSGRLVSIHNGRYDTVPISVVTGKKKVVNVEKYYSTERLRPKYDSFQHRPLFIMTSDA